MIIDFHTHVMPPRIKEERSRYVASDSVFASIFSDSNSKLATAEELIGSMDSNGIDISIMVNYGWATDELCTETNDYILESVARYPQRLIGFCTFKSQSCETAVYEIERCAMGGARGIGEIRPDLQSPHFKDMEAMKPLVETMRKHRLILLTHASEPVGHIYPGKGGATPDLLYPFISSFPDLPVVCAHWGGGLPFYALMPEVKQAMENVYFDTAASPFLYTPQVYPQVSQLVGAEKILFGSDYPLLTQSRLLNEINAADLTEEARKLILSGNAQRLLGIGDRV